MKKNDLLTLTADGLGADLEGVCRADGMAVFVPGMPVSYTHLTLPTNSRV